MTDEDDDEFEPLEVVPVPVAINAHDPDVGDPSVVRLFFRAGGHGGWPGGGIAEVFVIEDGERVSIGLVRREVYGQGADGMMYGESLQMGGWASLDVVLSGSLGTRSLLDASTGARPACRAPVRRSVAGRGSRHASLAMVLTSRAPARSCISTLASSWRGRRSLTTAHT